MRSHFTAANPLRAWGAGGKGDRDVILSPFLRFLARRPLVGRFNPISGSVTMAMRYCGPHVRSHFAVLDLLVASTSDEDGRHCSGRQLARNQWPDVVAEPALAQPTVLTQLNMGGDEASVWRADFPNQCPRPSGRRQHPPSSVSLLATGIYSVRRSWKPSASWICVRRKWGRTSPGFCVVCTTDIPVPSNVYRYITIPGTTYGGGSGGFT